MRKLLKLWRSHLGRAGMILLSVPKTMRSVIFGASDMPTGMLV